jgi:hypothetical protein
LVVIPNNASGTNDNPTVDVAAVCASLTLAAGDQPRTLTLSGSNSLTVSGAVTINSGSGSSDHKIIAVGSGTLSCTSISMADTGGDDRDCRVTVTSGIVIASGNISMSGSAARNQFTISGAGTLNIGGNISGGDFTLATGSTVNYNGSVVQIVRPAIYHTIKCNNSQAGLYTEAAVTASTLTIGDVTENSFFEIRWAFTSTGTLNLVSGTFKLGYSTTPLSWPGFTVHNISPGTTVEYGATAAQTVSAAPPYANLKVSGASTKSLSNNLTINGDLTVESDTLDLLTYTANRSTPGGTMTIADEATLLVKGTSNYPSNFETHALGFTSTVNYAMANAQNVADDSYGNLTLSGGNTKSFEGATEVRGTFSIASGTIANLGTSPANSSCIILKLNGINQVAGSYGSTASEATYKIAAYFGTTATAILNVDDAISWLGTTNTDWSTPSNWAGSGIPTATTNVIIPNTTNEPVIGSTAVCRNIIINSGSSLTISGTNTLTVHGNWYKPDGTPFYANSSTVVFKGLSDNIIEGWTVFYNLTIDKDSDAARVIDQDNVWPKTSFEVLNDLTVSKGELEMNGSDWDYFIGNNLTIGSEGTLTSNHWFPLHVKGDWIRSGGTYNHGNCHVIFDGTAAQNISAINGITFYNLTLAGNSVEVMNNTVVDVNGTLTVNPGTTLDINSTSTVNVID